MINKFPCEKYEGINLFDSFITHHNQLKYLLENCNDGRRKSFFCVAVNLLDFLDVKSIFEQIITKVKGLTDEIHI